MALYRQADVSDDGVVWRSVPLPRWARLHATPLPANRVSEHELKDRLSADSAVRLVWILRLSREWILEGVICWTKSWLLVVAACGFGMVGNGRLGTLTLALNCALSAAMFLAILVSYSNSSEGRMIPLGELSSATTIGIRLIGNVAMLAVLVWEGPFTVDAMCFSFGFLSTLIFAAKAEWVTGVLCAVLWSMAISLQMARWYVTTRVEGSLVLQDLKIFNAR
jgi:hypothetical protein